MVVTLCATAGVGNTTLFLVIIKREMNEPVMVTQATLFTSNYNYRVVHVLTAFLQNIVHIC